MKETAIGDMRMQRDVRESWKPWESCRVNTDRKRTCSRDGKNVVNQEREGRKDTPKDTRKSDK